MAFWEVTDPALLFVGDSLRDELAEARCIGREHPERGIVGAGQGAGRPNDSRQGARQVEVTADGDHGIDQSGGPVQGRLDVVDPPPQVCDRLLQRRAVVRRKCRRRLVHGPEKTPHADGVGSMWHDRAVRNSGMRFPDH